LGTQTPLPPAYNAAVMTTTGASTTATHLTNAAHAQRMREILAGGGVRAVLIYLNGLTEHRFTAMLIFHDDELLRSAYFYDR
jgi:hypothetical protein